jgi:hypothetical protein
VAGTRLAGLEDLAADLTDTTPGDDEDTDPAGISKPAHKAVLTACLPGVSYPNGAVPGSRQ